MQNIASVGRQMSRMSSDVFVSLREIQKVLEEKESIRNKLVSTVKGYIQKLEVGKDLVIHVDRKATAYLE